MLPPSTRLNYFDHQFLRRDDFKDEQAYHLGMRRAHNRMLHTPGVAQGLAVAVDGTGITVSEGVAIDAEGRELVLADDVERDLASTPGGTLWVTLVYREEAFDRTNETGAEGDRRIAERGEVAVTANEPAGDGLTLVLARVTRGEGGALRVDDGEGTARRRAASAVGGELRADSLEVRGRASAVALALTQDLTASAFAVDKGRVAGPLRAQSLQVDGASELGAVTTGAVTVKGEIGASDLVVDGNAKIGGALQVGADAGVGGTLRVQGEGRFGTRVGVGVAAPETQLHLAGGNANLAGTEGDLKIGTNTVRMKLGIGTGVAPGDGRIQVQGGNNRLMLGTGGTDILHLQNGGAGVGMPATSAGALTVAGGLHFGVSGAMPAPDRRLLATADGTLRWQVPLTAPTRALEVGPAGSPPQLRLDAGGPSFLLGGFLGVGLAAPEAPLHLTGGRDAIAGEGDVKIGTGTNRLKVGVAVAGPTAGEARLRAEGTAPRIMLGAGGADVLTVAPGGVGVGAVPTPGTMLNVGGVVNATEFLKNGAPLTSQWNNVSGGISYAAGAVGIGRAPAAGMRLALEGSLGFGNAASPMLYIYESGSTNAERPVAAHSPPFPDWGLSYRDLDDRMIFRGGGSVALTADLAGGRVGVGTDAPNVTLHAVGNRIRLNNPANTRSLEMRVDGAGTDLQSTGAPLFVNTGGSGESVLINHGSGKVGIGTDAPTAGRLTVGGTNSWDLANTDGDLMIGNATYKMKFGIALGGGGAGMAGIRSSNRLTLGAGATEGLHVNTDGSVTVAGRLDCLNLLIRSGAKPGYVFDHFVNQTGDPVEQGDVVVIGGNDATEFWSTGSNIPIPEVDLASAAYDTRVCGIVEYVVTEGDLPFAEARDEAPRPRKRGRGKKAAEDAAPEADAYAHPLRRYAAAAEEGLDRRQVGPGQLGNMVTMGAFSHCKVDADIAPIAVGDLLTTSPTRGHAQKVLDPAAAVGSIVAKALGSLSSGRGKIPVLVMLQ